MVSVSAVNEYGYSIDFAQDKDFTIIDIDGLHPIKSTINSSPIPDYRGSLFNSISYENRNIVISVAVNDYNSNGRNKLNQVFSTGSKVKLNLNNYSIDGYVESNEYNPFNSKIICQITIVCLQPYFYNGISHKVEITNLINSFTFPFSAPSAGIVLGEIKESYDTNVVNLGDIPCGCVITATFSNNVLGFRIFNEEKEQEIYIGGSFQNGDELTIDTRFAKKSVMFSGADTDYKKIDILGYLDNVTNWIELGIGNNMISYTDGSGSTASNKYIDVFVEYYEMVGGL